MCLEGVRSLGGVDCESVVCVWKKCGLCLEGVGGEVGLGGKAPSSQVSALPLSQHTPLSFSKFPTHSAPLLAI